MMNNIITTAGSSSAASNNTSVTRGAFESSAYAAMENALEGSTSTPMHNSQARDGTTYAQKLQSLTRLRNKLKEWPSPPILIHVAESLTSDNIIVKLSGSKEVEKSQQAAYDSNATYGKAKDRKGTVQQFSTFCNNKISSESES